MRNPLLRYIYAFSIGVTEDFAGDSSRVLHVILYQPEIPPNTGNIIRLCANTGASLHLIEPMGFTLDDRKLRRAGLDYHEWARVAVHESLNSLLKNVPVERVLAFTTRASRRYDTMTYLPGDALLFGPETRGLPTEVLNNIEPRQRLGIPMLESSRSLNLSNAVAVAVYEAWRQLGFEGQAN